VVYKLLCDPKEHFFGFKEFVLAEEGRNDFEEFHLSKQIQNEDFLDQLCPPSFIENKDFIPAFLIRQD
jgi:hypothetical protein